MKKLPHQPNERKSVIQNGAKIRNDEFWDQNRLVKIRESERLVDKMANDLRKSKLYYWGPSAKA